MSDKHVAACVEYVAAKKEIDRLKGEIGAAIGRCLAAQEASGVRLLDEGNMQASHLKKAYAMEREPSDCGYGYQSYFANHDDDVEGYLAEQCSHCFAAHNLIQLRKKARQRFGAAKRRISVLGRPA